MFYKMKFIAILAAMSVFLTACGDSRGKAVSNALASAMKGCQKGSNAKVEVVAKTWNPGIVFTCEWVVSEDAEVLNGGRK